MVSAVAKLVEYGFVEITDDEDTGPKFRLVGNAHLFRLIQDVNDMHASRQTQFARCKCGHLHDDNWECEHCKSKPKPEPEVIRPRFATGGQREFGGAG